MATAYKGRHTGGANPTSTPAVGKTPTTAHGLTNIVRRPLVSAAAILAVAAVSAASASEATPNVSGVSYTASPMAKAQAAELSSDRNDTNTALAAARASGVQRSSVLTHQQKAAADALVQARVQARVRASAAAAQAQVAAAQARVAATERSARDHERQGLLERAKSNPQAAARLLASDRGWGAAQFDCLNSLWNKESGWRWNANNGASGAYGIPQALPGSKMASAGSDWASNPITQIKWGMGYIANRYGTPCSAWAHSQAMNWY